MKSGSRYVLSERRDSSLAYFFFVCLCLLHHGFANENTHYYRRTAYHYYRMLINKRQNVQREKERERERKSSSRLNHYFYGRVCGQKLPESNFNSRVNFSRAHMNGGRGPRRTDLQEVAAHCRRGIRDRFLYPLASRDLACNAN